MNVRPPVTCALREDSGNDEHVMLSVFIGRGTRAHCGNLVLQRDQWLELLARGDRSTDEVVQLSFDLIQ